MNTKINILTIFGSGETSPYMAKTYRSIFNSYPNLKIKNPVILSTPFEFQENSNILSQKIFDYFEKRLNIKPTVSSLRQNSHKSIDIEKIIAEIKNSDFLFSGPGSPTYALGLWKKTKIDKIIKSKIYEPGIIAFSSAAALTLGTYTLPVYEIYKAGIKPYWEKGLDLLKFLGIKTIIVPHYNNQEGRDHDTSHCFIGKNRFKKLLENLQEDILYIGIDEHTACIFNINESKLQVMGKGQAHFGSKSKIFSLKSGESIKFDDILYKQKISPDLNKIPKEKFKNHHPVTTPEDSSHIVSIEIEELLKIREIARLNNNWDMSDKIRSILESKGISIKDTKEKTFWEKNN